MHWLSRWDHIGVKEINFHHSASRRDLNRECKNAIEGFEKGDDKRPIDCKKVIVE